MSAPFLDLAISYSAVARLARSFLRQLAGGSFGDEHDPADKVIGALLASSSELYVPQTFGSYMTAAKKPNRNPNPEPLLDSNASLTDAGTKAVANVQRHMSLVRFPAAAIATMGWLKHFGLRCNAAQPLSEMPTFTGPQTPLDVVVAAATMNAHSRRSSPALTRIYSDTIQMFFLVSVGSTQALVTSPARLTKLERLGMVDLASEARPANLPKVSISSLATVSDGGHRYLQQLESRFSDFVDPAKFDSVFLSMAALSLVLRGSAHDLGFDLAPTLMPGVDYSDTKTRRQLKVTLAAEWPGTPGASNGGNIRKARHASAVPNLTSKQPEGPNPGCS